MTEIVKRGARVTPRREEFPHWTPDVVRFGDLDSQGHVNNAVFSTYFEAGRNAICRLPDLGVGVPGATFVLVHTEIHFLRELRWPGTVEIGTAVVRLGRTSFTTAQAIFSEATCVASAGATLVLIDKKTGAPRPLPQSATERLSQWKRADAADSDVMRISEGAC